MKKLILSLCLTLPGLTSLFAQKTIEIPFTPVSNNSITWKQEEQTVASKLFSKDLVTNVSKPSLTSYLPDPAKANGTAIIIAPGGAFHFLDINSEGVELAKWLADRGVTAFVLRYRLVPTKDLDTEVKAIMGSPAKTDEKAAPVIPYAIADGQEAIKFVRTRASEYNIDRNKVGIIGFSAGGTVAVSTAMKYGQNDRPDFVAAIYPCVHCIDRQRLLIDAPPLFVAAAEDDQLDFDKESAELVSRWIRSGKSAKMHLYKDGGHGFGMKKQNLGSDVWVEDFGKWLTENGWMSNFRDLNHNGKKDIYEDITQTVDKRVEDLLAQMTLEEKAGMMFINGAPVNQDASLEYNPQKAGGGFAAAGPAAIDHLKNLHMNHFNLWQIPSDPKVLALWHNNLQAAAARSRLGIPVTLASDPRNHFSNTIFAMSASGFSQWPEMPGFAAIGDAQLVERFADIVRQEYMAVGIRQSLHPQIDLATEPRWPRISGSMSEDANLTSQLVTAYLRGMQSRDLKAGVACMTKHFPGGGPQKEGLDAHFPFHKGQVYPGKNFDYHLKPFEAAIKAGTAAIMPYYGVPTGQTGEEVGMAFNKSIITTLLREKYKFDGVVCTDWGLITDLKTPAFTWPARAWGVEKLSPAERVKKAIDAGVDQFGGENCPEHIIQLVKEGKIAESRIDQSVRRLLRQKFDLGLFDNPFVDYKFVDQIVGNSEFQQAADNAQRRAMTLLKNDGAALPLKPKTLKIYVKNIKPEVAAQYGTVVNNPADADIAIVRLNTPWVPVQTDIPFAKGFHHGDLDFKGNELSDVLDLCKKVPTVVDIYLDRPAVIPEINAAAKAVVANYGASDAAVLDVLFGVVKPEGKLPFELPSSMEAVRNQKEDLPYDSKDPLYPFGHGLKYE